MKRAGPLTNSSRRRVDRSRHRRCSTAVAFVAMAGSVVESTLVRVVRRSCARSATLVVLGAVALGLLFGAVACAAGLSGGLAHGATGVSDSDIDVLPGWHADHSDSMSWQEPDSTSTGQRGGHPENSSTPGSHPGMACVVSVNLAFPEVSSAVISDSSEITLLGLSPGCPADVDPPVPRFS